MGTSERIYTVTAPTARRDVDVHGNVTDVYDIYWQGPSGIADKVTVPVASYTPDVVDRLIKQQLQRHLDVLNLGLQ